MPQEIRRLQFSITTTHSTRKSENRRALVDGGIELRF